MQKQLRDGLILRTLSEGHASDREQLPHFYAAYNGEGEPEGVPEGLVIWTQDLINNHPLVSHDDIFVVVDPAHGDRIVSATLLIPQQWRYEDVPLLVGRPELVATHPEYRARGLVRTLFDAIHERSAALGHQLQVITGIPYFYRQFGYTMAVELGSGAAFPLHLVADPAPDYTPTFTLRPATLDDIPMLTEWYDSMARERLLTLMHSPETWRYQLEGRNPESVIARSYQIIVRRDDSGQEGQGVGYIELSGNLYNRKALTCEAYVVGKDASYLETFDDVMRGIKQWAETTFGECPPLLLIAAGNHSSIYMLVKRTLGGSLFRSYRWYLRVPDTIAFLRHIQPVLERRLEGSGAHRYTGDLKIGFHNLTGIGFTFERGRIVEIAPLTGKDGYHISFPWHLFWNVVFGDQSADEINALLPDTWASNGKTEVLLDTLFPKKRSWVEGLS